MQAHLEAIGRAVAPSSHALLILDKVGWHTTRKHTERYTELSPDRFKDSALNARWLRGWRLFRLALERRARIVAAMGFLDNALTLITLVSLFLLGPALGRALVACFENWQDWWLPIQHLAVGICTMIAVTAMILAYGALWKLSPKSVAWYSWIQEVPVAGNVNVTAPVEVRQPLKR